METIRNITKGWVEVLLNIQSWTYIFANTDMYASNIWWNMTSFSSVSDWMEYDELYYNYVEKYS